jgi:hypothetical protein
MLSDGGRRTLPTLDVLLGAPALPPLANPRTPLPSFASYGHPRLHAAVSPSVIAVANPHSVVQP